MVGAMRRRRAPLDQSVRHRAIPPRPNRPPQYALPGNQWPNTRRSGLGRRREYPDRLASPRHLGPNLALRARLLQRQIEPIPILQQLRAANRRWAVVRLLVAHRAFLDQL